MAVQHPWIIATSEPWGAWCQRCDQRLPIRLPVEINEYLAAMKAFVERHAACQEREGSAS